MSPEPQRSGGRGRLDKALGRAGGLVSGGRRAQPLLTTLFYQESAGLSPFSSGLHYNHIIGAI